MNRPAIPYVAPFGVFVVLMAAAPLLKLGVWEYPVRVFLLLLVLLFVSRRVIDLRAPRWLGSVLLGLALFVVWVAPDLLWPGYRGHWLFQNALLGRVRNSLPPGFQHEPMVLIFRSIRAALIVPVVEELFWRAFLPRWAIRRDFESIALGFFTPASFWLTAFLFAAEHGPFWDVGLLAGIAYNGWMARTKSLGDCILAHAVTNAALSAYIILAGKWEYWA